MSLASPYSSFHQGVFNEWKPFFHFLECFRQAREVLDCFIRLDDALRNADEAGNLGWDFNGRHGVARLDGGEQAAESFICWDSAVRPAELGITRVMSNGIGTDGDRGFPNMHCDHLSSEMSIGGSILSIETR